MNNTKVFLTGANGMVGRNISDQKPAGILLLQPGSKELDLLNASEVSSFLSLNKPDYIIHAAGIVGGIQANINHPVRFLRENTLMAHNLIWAAYENKIPYLINLGSSCMYPVEAANPYKEDLILTGSLEPTNEGYALAKIFAQRFCSYINKERNNSNYKTIIPCNLYGKYDKFDAEWGHMIPSVIRKIHEAKQNGDKSVEVWGDGTAKREFMYVEDLAKFIWSTLEDLDSMPELMNVGLGHDFTIKEYYEAVADVVGYKGEFVYDTSKPVGMKQKLVDTSVMSAYKALQATDLEKGLNKTYNFFLETH